mgnify:FL=1
MPQTIQSLVEQYVACIKEIYGAHLREVILYGSYARGDYNAESDVDIMILLDLTDYDIKGYRHQLSDATFEFNMGHDMDIKPIAKNLEHFERWTENYPFYANVKREGITLYAA